MAVPKVDRVAVAPLRERFQWLEHRYGWTAYRVAEDLGWTRSRRTAVIYDAIRVKRTLGLVNTHHTNGKKCAQQYTSYAQAVRLCRALDMDPFEAGV